MNIGKFYELVDNAKYDLGDMLLSCGVWNSEGRLFSSFNSEGSLIKPHEAAGAFSDLTFHLASSLKVEEFPYLKNYYLLNLKKHLNVLIIFYKNYQAGFALDMKKMSLSVLLNLFVPEILQSFIDAVDG